MATSDFTGIVGRSRHYSHDGWSRGILTGGVVWGFVSFAAQPVTAAAGVELGDTAHLRFHAEFGKEATSFTLGRVLGS